jgi:hypothetical protein
MRKLLLLAALSVGAMGVPAAAQVLTQVSGPTTGNVCTGAGGINNCIATQSGVVQGATTDPLASALIARITAGEGETPATDVSSLFPTIDGSEFDWSIANNILTFTYDPAADDPAIHYLGLSQANTYFLFYDAAAITSATFNLSDYFQNPGLSHIDVFDRTTAVPEPGTWAMMILGFGAAGYAMRRRRKLTGARLA